MRDDECFRFLQWALPNLRMRWPGFRKVRRQVCKRVAGRLLDLGLRDTFAYRVYIEAHAEEWERLDEFCRISISRFYRDHDVFECLANRVFPRRTGVGEEAPARFQVWSAGCGGGEEPYTLAMLWRFSLRQQFPGVELHLVATDADPGQLERARAACYGRGSLRELPPVWIEQAFDESRGLYYLRPELGAGVEFCQQDIREEMPDGPFDLVLCRNLVFTYFDEGLQREIGHAVHKRLVPGGVLVLGRREVLPEHTAGFHRIEPRLPLYRSDA
jgi:chemotaxis protein methyltransferase CheR